MGKRPENERGPKRAEAESNAWPVADALQRFADLLDAAATRGPQMIVDNNRGFQLRLAWSRRSPKAKELLLSRGRLPVTEKPEGSKK